ncbi:hypothetical protein PENSPDRAFT_652742 [Peniophora sp. CONT]|nr:hypothetical protein PENSPDRAFT_652742 [Peniophora sp. CONT]
MAPEGLSALWGFGSTLSAFVALPLVESSRAGRSFIFRWPTPLLLGLMYQLQGVAVWYNIYWLAMIALGQLNARRGPRVVVNRAAAEANLFAVLVGFILPSQAMLSFQAPLITAGWLLFPVWVTLARGVYIFCRPRNGGNGYMIVQATYLVTFVHSVYGNGRAIWLLGDNLSSYLATLPPSIEPPAYAGSTLTVAALQLINWDWIVTAIGGLLATLWIAKSPREIAFIVAWNVFTTPLFGAGAAVSGVLMWREKQLNGSKAR